MPSSKRSGATPGGLLTVAAEGAGAGMHLVGFLPEGTDDRKVVEHPAQQGVSVSALSSCYAGRSCPGLLLGFGAAHEADTDAAVHTLATAMRTVL